jgi:putative hemolysin
MDIAFSIIFTFVLVIFNGFFACAELATVNVRKPKLQQLASDGSKKAARTLEVSEDIDRLLATIQIAITLIGFGASAVAATTIAEPLQLWFESWGISWLAAIAPGFSVLVVTVVVAYVTLVLGELVPKRIALANSEKVAMGVSGALSTCEKLFGPMVWLVSVSTNGVARLLGIKSTDGSAVSEEEIKLLVDEQETLLDEEKRMINEIFDLGDTSAREIMVPRVDMIAVEDDMTVRQVVDRMRGTGLSRLPVYHETIDRIVGVAMLKDLLVSLIEDRDDEEISAYMRPAVFVPETKDILPLLSEMQNEHQQLVIVVDEYGGTSGLVTAEDIVEEVVGEIADEYDPDRKYITELSDGEWIIDGRLPVDDAMERGLPVMEGDDYETVAGWLMDTIDYVPQVGDVFEIEGFRFLIQAMRRKRISLMRVTRLPEEETVLPSEL